LFVIGLIGRDATPAKIARWMFREPHSISEILERMGKKGLLKKVKDLGRKNQVRIEITEKGYDVYRRSFIPRSIPDIFSGLPKHERAQFIASLKKLRKSAVKRIGIKYEVPLPPLEK
jgi:DNA-binding MarR family transcriptional regulator